MQREEDNLNQHRSQLEVYGAHLRKYERRCDRHEGEIRAVRMRGTDIGSEGGS
jgi:hypothetical protein